MNGTIQRILLIFFWGENGKVGPCLETFRVMEMNVVFQVVERTWHCSFGVIYVGNIIACMCVYELLCACNTCFRTEIVCMSVKLYQNNY